MPPSLPAPPFLNNEVRWKLLLSEQNKINRSTEPTYFGGRVGMASYQQQLDRHLERDTPRDLEIIPSQEVLRATKTKGCKKLLAGIFTKLKKKYHPEEEGAIEDEPQEEESPQVQWGNPESELQFAKYQELLEEKYADNPSAIPNVDAPIDLKLWIQAGHKKGHGRIEGLGGSIRFDDIPQLQEGSQRRAHRMLQLAPGPSVREQVNDMLLANMETLRFPTIEAMLEDHPNMVSNIRRRLTGKIRWIQSTHRTTLIYS